jgi:transcription-repair coupling factor (superfamily II helicase)
MSMVGIRDISALQTPPVDRRAIATQVRPFERSLIRDVILRELNRDGQVYFIHNIVRSIAAMADSAATVPAARRAPMRAVRSIGVGIMVCSRLRVGVSAPAPT